MKVNRSTLLWAIKRSNSLAEVTQRLEREPEYEERLLEKMCRFYPEAEDYLIRNSSLQEMREHKAEEAWDALKESRLEYVGATYRLMKNKML